MGRAGLEPATIRASGGYPNQLDDRPYFRQVILMIFKRGYKICVGTIQFSLHFPYASSNASGKIKNGLFNREKYVKFTSNCGDISLT